MRRVAAGNTTIGCPWAILGREQDFVAVAGLVLCVCLVTIAIEQRWTERRWFGTMSKGNAWGGLPAVCGGDRDRGRGKEVAGGMDQTYWWWL